MQSHDLPYLPVSVVLVVWKYIHRIPFFSSQSFGVSWTVRWLKSKIKLGMLQDTSLETAGVGWDYIGSTVYSCVGVSSCISNLVLGCV